MDLRPISVIHATKIIIVFLGASSPRHLTAKVTKFICSQSSQAHTVFAQQMKEKSPSSILKKLAVKSAYHRRRNITEILEIV